MRLEGGEGPAARPHLLLSSPEGTPLFEITTPKEELPAQRRGQRVAPLPTRGSEGGGGGGRRSRAPQPPLAPLSPSRERRSHGRRTRFVAGSQQLSRPSARARADRTGRPLREAGKPSRKGRRPPSADPPRAEPCRHSAPPCAAVLAQRGKGSSKRGAELPEPRRPLETSRAFARLLRSCASSCRNIRPWFR